jgi:tetratricopeptide (TPR) repeat protein
MTFEKIIRVSMFYILLWFCAVGTGWLVGVASAQLVPGYPDNIREYDLREVALLPRYCIYTQLFRDRVPGGNNPEEIEKCYATMGKTFHAMHHYCWGLMKSNRAKFLTSDRQVREFYLADAINEFNYVIRHAQNDFVLLPEILTKKGENLILLGRVPEAMGEMKRALALRPDYWLPYAIMSEHYKNAGNRDRAKELLRDGLARSPDNKHLKGKLAELEKGKGK